MSSTSSSSDSSPGRKTSGKASSKDGSKGDDVQLIRNRARKDSSSSSQSSDSSDSSSSDSDSKKNTSKSEDKSSDKSQIKDVKISKEKKNDSPASKRSRSTEKRKSVSDTSTRRTRIDSSDSKNKTRDDDNRVKSRRSTDKSRRSRSRDKSSRNRRSRSRNRRSRSRKRGSRSRNRRSRSRNRRSRSRNRRSRSRNRGNRSRDRRSRSRNRRSRSRNRRSISRSKDSKNRNKGSRTRNSISRDKERKNRNESSSQSRDRNNRTFDGQRKDSPKSSLVKGKESRDIASDPKEDRSSQGSRRLSNQSEMSVKREHESESTPRKSTSTTDAENLSGEKKTTKSTSGIGEHEKQPVSSDRVRPEVECSPNKDNLNLKTSKSDSKKDVGKEALSNPKNLDQEDQIVASGKQTAEDKKSENERKHRLEKMLASGNKNSKTESKPTSSESVDSASKKDKLKNIEKESTTNNSKSKNESHKETSLSKNNQSSSRSDHREPEKTKKDIDEKPKSTEKGRKERNDGSDSSDSDKSGSKTSRENSPKSKKILVSKSKPSNTSSSSSDDEEQNQSKRKDSDKTESTKQNKSSKNTTEEKSANEKRKRHDSSDSDENNKKKEKKPKKDLSKESKKSKYVKKSSSSEDEETESQRSKKPKQKKKSKSRSKNMSSDEGECSTSDEESEQTGKRKKNSNKSNDEDSESELLKKKRKIMEQLRVEMEMEDKKSRQIVEKKLEDVRKYEKENPEVKRKENSVSEKQTSEEVVVGKRYWGGSTSPTKNSKSSDTYWNKYADKLGIEINDPNGKELAYRRSGKEKDEQRSKRDGSSRHESSDKREPEAKTAAFIRKPVVDPLQTRTGGAYIPPAKLRMMQHSITDKNSAAFQRLAWEALKKSINGLVNKVNVSNIGIIVRELMRENVIRGRGQLCRSLMQAQAFSQTFTNVYAALVAVLNCKFHQVGELLLTRLIVQFRRGIKRNDKTLCLSSCRFIAHLVNQQIAHEIVALEILTFLLEKVQDVKDTTETGDKSRNNCAELAAAFLTECGQKLKDTSPKCMISIFDSLKNIINEGKLEDRLKYMFESVWAAGRGGFKDNPSVLEELDLVEEDDQVTHILELDAASLDTQDMLNVFKHDPEYEKNEEQYKEIKSSILGGSDDDEDGESGDESGSGSDEDDSDEEENKKDDMTILDQTEGNMLAFRRIIYLTLKSSLTVDEAAHKILKGDIKPGWELELCNMILDCCAQERTFMKFFALVAQRFCNINKVYQDCFIEIFTTAYDTCHRLETEKLRNVAKLFAHLFVTDAISWMAFSCVRLDEDNTTSSSRVFLKIIFQEMTEFLGLSKLNGRMRDPTLLPAYEGLLPRDNPQHTRFAINFFTSIGLGGLTDDLREFLRTQPKPTAIVAPVVQKEDSSSSSESSSESSESSSDSSSSSSDSSSSDSSDDSSSSSSDDDKSSRKKKKNKRSAARKKNSSRADTREGRRNVERRDEAEESDE